MNARFMQSDVYDEPAENDLETILVKILERGWYLVLYYYY